MLAELDEIARLAAANMHNFSTLESQVVISDKALEILSLFATS